MALLFGFFARPNILGQNFGHKNQVRLGFIRGDCAIMAKKRRQAKKLKYELFLANKPVNYRYPEGYRLPKGGWLGHKTKIWKQTYVGKVMTPKGLPPQILAIVATS
ncbi:MAG: hypothetical protein LBI10_05205 [Deltaproteobacteria bacterium]|nr:hypothetical protein [Deltaproteobacteria bacterium]